MRIPQRLAYVLERDQELDGAVRLSLAQLEPWINHSNLPFFPEYTKHDLEHIESVLVTAVALIRDEAWETITAADAAVLILGVLLHDCAMHLLEDGFISLLEPNRSEQCIPGMGDKPWLVLWEDFCGEASRFDGRKLIRLFGDTIPIRRPPLDPTEMTMRDRLLIGEFLRRHHPRLAQEIALFGVPTKGKSPLIFQGFSGARNYIAGLSGIVARSHGADIRTFLPFLRDYFDIRQYKGVHTVFLMTLLRIADYIQIDAERAPAQVLQVKQLTSPVSQGEWKAHHAIKDVRHTHEDPEALFIDAAPEDAQTFFRVEEWARGIQQELDASWAVLGEVYGRYEGLSKLGLVLRRIRSTLDDPQVFSQKISYLPIRAAFRASDADLLKLLIGPLYGNRPEIGLRELIQNSVDAVRELMQYVKDVPGLGEIRLTDQEADVVLSIEKLSPNETWVTVSDRGIGMSPKIVVDYFLTAGASFRRSEDWRRMFETKEGKSKVIRAGRFGVGALASFLLGPEIEVSSRHVDEPEGLEFKASVDTEFVELRRVKRPVGTTVKIRIPDALVKQLEDDDSYDPDRIDWDWYCLSHPSVTRKVLENQLPQEHHLPGSGGQLPSDWRRISHPDYEDIQWTYSHVPALTCNGIRVLSYKWDDPFPEANWPQRFGLKVPNLSVFDPDGRLPLNLQRTASGESKYPFDAALANDVIRDFVAHSLVFGPTKVGSWNSSSRYEGLVRETNDTEPYGVSYLRNRQPWYFTKEGFGFLDPSILHSQRFQSLLVVEIEGSGTATATLEQVRSGPMVLVERPYQTTSESDHLLRKMIRYANSDKESPEAINNDYYDERPENWSIGGEDILRFMKRKGARLLISVSSWSRIVTSSRIRKSLRDLLTKEWTESRWHLFRIGNCPQPLFDFASFASSQVSDRPSLIMEVYIEFDEKPEISPIGSQWLKILKSCEIPYDVELRRKKLEPAYDELATYISAHEEMRRS